MGSHGIRDRVAIVGVGCTTFGEHWNRSADDLVCFAGGGAYDHYIPSLVWALAAALPLPC